MLNDRVGALFPGQANIRAEASFRTSAFVAGLHDPWPGAGDDHPAFGGNFAGEFDGLEVFSFGRQRSRRSEHGHFASRCIGSKQFVGVTQFPNRSLNDAHVAAGLDILEQFEGILDYVGDEVLIEAAFLELDQLLDTSA